MLALALVASAPAAAQAETPADRPQVTIAMLPAGVEVDEIAAALPDASLGLLSAGLGPIPASQTFIDIAQGGRLNGSLYPELLPPLYVVGNRVPVRLWSRVRERALDAPAELDPGLLASALRDRGVRVAARPLAGSPSLIGVDRGGRVSRTKGCEAGVCPGLTITSVGLIDLPRLDARLGSGDLLIALERPPPERDLLAIGIVGDGFGARGLTSATTRMDGYVLSTDLLPTIFERYGIPVPDGVSGQRIELTGNDLDAAALTGLEDRLGAVGDRRWEVLAVNLIVWIGLSLIAIAIGRGIAARRILPLAAVTIAYIPAILLVAAAVEPSELVERLMVGIGAPGSAALTIAALRRRLAERAPFGAFTIAATASVAGTALDMLAGSPLTALSLLGPNPNQGVRFYGIGNELEAVIGALLLLGAGAAVAAWKPDGGARPVAIVATVAVLIAVAIFAPGRFGADVGAAITFPAGAAAAVIAALALRGRRAALIVIAPALALIALVAVDLALGGDSHLSRSVLSAGGFDQLGQVFERRITLGARTFPRYLDSPFFIATIAAIVLAVVYRNRILVWFERYPAARTGVIGAIAATVVGTLANDSAALLLMFGSAFVAAFVGLVWAISADATDREAR